MLFNTLPFLLFFAVVLVLFYASPQRWRLGILLLSSFYFYLSFVPLYLIVPLSIIAVDYVFALKIEKQSTETGKNRYFIAALIFNVGLLVFFKYFNFLSANLNSFLSGMQLHDPIPLLTWVLPIGISYYIFQSISYLVDVKNERIPAEKKISHLSLYVLFFPQISGGPINRGGQLLPQFEKEHRFNAKDFTIGFSHVMLGYFKKVVVGDMLGNYVNTFFGSYEQHSGFAIIVACWIFLLQLYADFSGYSDIAIGLARMLGFKLQINFAVPLFSKTMTELWRRWHISFSTWLRDYLYTPLYIAKRDWGIFAIIFAQLLTFAICGLWHGAGWQFLIYGLIHGIYLITEYFLGIKSSFYNKNFLRKCLGVFITFNLLSIPLILFRSQSFAQATNFFSNILYHFGPVKPRVYDTVFFITMLIMTAVMLLIDYLYFRKNDINSLYERKPYTLLGLNIFWFILILLFGISSNTQFIYFQF